MRKCVLCHMQTTKAQISLHIRAVSFVVRCPDSIMSLVSVTKIPSLMLASVAEQASSSLTWLETPEDTFSLDEAQLYEPPHDKTNKMNVHPAKTQISLGIRLV